MNKKIYTLFIVIFCSAAAMAQKEYTGKITDSVGNPVPGATINLKNSNTGTTSGPDGSFKIKGKENAAITVTAVGFKKTETSLGKSDNIDITLKNANQFLEEVVVTALGVKREKRNR